MYDRIDTPACDQNDKAFKMEILSIHEMGFDYARDFKKFNREVILFILLELIFSKFTMGAVALTVIGICTIGKGIINFALDYCLIGVVMTIIGFWLVKIRLNAIMEGANR